MAEYVPHLVMRVSCSAHHIAFTDIIGGFFAIYSYMWVGANVGIAVMPQSLVFISHPLLLYQVRSLLLLLLLQCCTLQLTCF